APRNRTEQVLAEIWCDVLDLDRIGVNDDFFALGGASTQSLEVAVRANEAGLGLRPESMFVYGTIAELATEYGPVAGDGPDRSEGRGGGPAHAVDVEAAEPDVAAAAEKVPASPREARNTVIESLGVYLPAR